MLASWGLGNPELGVVMLGLFVVFIMFGFPIAFTLMALGFGFGYMAMGDIVFALVVQRAYSAMTNDTLVAIPLFVFMGYIIERANILDRLFHSIQDRKSTRLNSSHANISYAVFCLKKKK